jgi:hypothetical protein
VGASDAHPSEAFEGRTHSWVRPSFFVPGAVGSHADAGGKNAGSSMEGQQTGGEQQQNTGDATGQQQAGQQTGQQAGNGGSGDDKRFTQAELDAIVRDRLDRQRRATEAQQQKDREATEAKALEEQQEFKKLADQRAEKVAELEPFKAKAERYEAALTALLEAERKDIPEHLVALLDKLDPAEQLEWIATNREAIGGAGAGTNGTRSVPATGRASSQAPSLDERVNAAEKRLVASGRYGRL